MTTSTSDKTVVFEYATFMEAIETIEGQLVALKKVELHLSGVAEQLKKQNKDIPKEILSEKDRIKKVKADFINGLINAKNEINNKFNITKENMTEDELEEVEKYRKKINCHFEEIKDKFGIKFN